MAFFSKKSFFRIFYRKHFLYLRQLSQSSLGDFTFKEKCFLFVLTFLVFSYLFLFSIYTYMAFFLHLSLSLYLAFPKSLSR